MKHLTVCILLISCGQSFQSDLFIEDIKINEMDAGNDIQSVDSAIVYDSNIYNDVTNIEADIIVDSKSVKCCGNASNLMPCNTEYQECSFVYDSQTYMCYNGKWVRTENHWSC